LSKNKFILLHEVAQIISYNQSGTRDVCVVYLLIVTSSAEGAELITCCSSGNI